MLKQFIECMEEFFLRGIFSRNKLNIVHHQDVHIPEAIAELCIPALLNCGNQFIDKCLGCHIK